MEKKNKETFTEEEIKNMSFYERRAALIAELNKNLVKNRETDDYDYIDLKGINQYLQPLKVKYKITDIPYMEENKDLGLIMVDSVTGEKKDKVTVPWPGLDPEHNNMRTVQVIGANITYLRRYLLMLAYDINVPKDFYDEQKQNFSMIPEVLPQKETTETKKQNSKPSDSSDLVYTSLDEYVKGEKQAEKEETVVYETDGEELKLDPSRGRKNNIYDDAENYIVKNGKYAGMPLCEVREIDPNEFVSMARQGNILEPELQNYAEILLKKYNL